LTVIVADNQSTDRTREIAEQQGVRVISEAIRNIGHVRNAGARASSGETLVFLDADTDLRPGCVERISVAMADPRCMGGSVRVEYARSSRWWVRPYLMGWEFWGRVLRILQGAAQFVRRKAFEELGGYDATIYVGEDIEFLERLKKLSAQRGGYTIFIERPRVVTSSRRFTLMSIPRIIAFTNPLVILLFWRVKWIWKDWYERAVT
jgi:glycosyltransferase involved in cell wall biosynthesis